MDSNLRMNDKDVLVFSSDFPPDQSGRAERMGTRMKYLIRRTEWTPTIILPLGQKKSTIRIDDQDVTVYRSLDDQENISEEENLDSVQFLKKSITNPQGLRDIRTDRKTQEVIEYIKSMAVPVPLPDLYTPYIPILTRRLCRLVHTEEVDVLNTMCHPFSFHIAGLLTKLITDVTWLAEFRDPWVTNPRVFDGEAGWYSRKLESLTVSHADRIVYNYGIQVPENYFETQYPRSSHKIERIDCPGATGFDFENVDQAIDKVDQFTIVYGGSFSGDRHTPETFLKGFQRFIENGNFPTTPSVHFYGDWRSDFDSLVSTLGLDDHVTSHGWIDSDPFFKEVQKAHAALYIVRPYEGDERNVPQKVTDYMALETPIFALCHNDWEAAQFIQQANAGIVVHPDKPADVERKLSKLYTLWENERLDEYTAGQEALERVDARYLAEEFGACLDRALNHST